MLKYYLLLVVALFIFASSYAQKEYKALMNDPSVNFYDVCSSAESYFKTHGKDKGSGWKGYQRWKVANEYKFYPTGVRNNIDPYFPEKAYSQFLANNQQAMYTNAWMELGPNYVDSITGQYSVGIGRIMAIYVDASDSLKMYIGSRSGGFWRSADGGQNWQCTTDTLIATGVNAIAVSPSNADSVLINVENARNEYSHGIYRSTDGGISWTQSNFNPNNLGYGGLGSNFRIYKIAYHPQVANLIFIGTNKGLFKSSNNLQTWTQIISSGDITDFAFHPTNDSIIYVYNSYYYGGNRNKINISSNRGQSFTSYSFTGNNNKKAWLSTSNDCSNCIYFASESGVWKSINNGQSFTFMSNPNENCLGFAVNDLDTSNMIYGYVDIHASTNGGQSFSKVTRWSLGNTNGAGSGHQTSFETSTDYVHADLHPAICVNGNYYVGTDGWFCKGSSDGTHWEILNQGTGVRENYKLGISQSNHFRSISGSQDNGTSIKHKDTWLEFYGADGMEGIIHPLNDDYMIGSVQYGTRKRTQDGGQTNQGVTPPGSNQGYWEAPIAYDPLHQMRIYDFRDSVYKSEDFGDNWSSVGKASVIYGTIKQAAIAENNSNIMAIASNQNIERSTDGGKTFYYIRNGLPNYSIEDIAFDPTNDSVIIVVYASYQNDGKKVYITSNLGQSWTNITYNLGNMPIRSVVIDNTPARNIYLGAEIGVYTKPMNGNTWVLYNPGLPNVTIEEMEINYGSNTIKAATWGRGLWEYSVLGRSTYPKILSTKTTDLPTINKPVEGMLQTITSLISYSGNLSSVFVKWGKDTIALSNTIAMTNTVDSTWVSNASIPNFAAGSRIYFKVFAVGSNGDTSATYRFMYDIHTFEYCNATGNNNGGNLYIKDVNIANINNSSMNDAYSFYANKTVDIYRDSSYLIEVVANNTWSGNDYGAWIDFNHNASFDIGENLQLIEISGDSARAVFTVPSNAYLMDTTALRIRLSYWGNPSPCGNTLGEVEDYPVLIHAIDNTPPVLDSSSLADYYEECSATPPAPTASDNMVGTIYGVANVSFPISTLGTTTIVWTFTDANGNFVQQNQNIIVGAVNTSVNVSGFTLSAVASNYNYQWVDCINSFNPISGANQQSFTPTSNGDYAIILSGNACADTSSCYTIVGLSIKELSEQMNIEVYPNPSTGIVQIEHKKDKEIMLEVLDITGRQVYTTKLSSHRTEVNLSNYADGIYLFKFYSKDEVYYMKLIKE